MTPTETNGRITDEMVEAACAAAERRGCPISRETARAALEAVLPPLLERVEAAEGRLAEEQREHDKSLALTDAALDQRDALAAKVADAVGGFVDRLSVTYRKLSGYGVLEVMQLAVDEFGVDPEPRGWSITRATLTEGTEGV